MQVTLLVMRLSNNQHGQPIAVAPKYLRVPATQETAAEKALATIYPPTTADVNLFTKALELVVDPRLDAAGQTKAWYTFGDPGLVPVLEYAYLSGAEGRVIETRSQFSQGADVGGTEVLCKPDFGCGTIASVGAYKNAGGIIMACNHRSRSIFAALYAQVLGNLGGPSVVETPQLGRVEYPSTANVRDTLNLPPGGRARGCNCDHGRFRGRLSSWLGAVERRVFVKNLVEPRNVITATAPAGTSSSGPS
jgi:hypothetical protein